MTKFLRDAVIQTEPLGFPITEAQALVIEKVLGLRGESFDIEVYTDEYLSTYDDGMPDEMKYRRVYVETNELELNTDDFEKIDDEF